MPGQARLTATGRATCCRKRELVKPADRGVLLLGADCQIVFSVRRWNDSWAAGRALRWREKRGRKKNVMLCEITKMEE